MAGNDESLAVRGRRGYLVYKVTLDTLSGRMLY
jgi:hypothetical protein